MAVLIGLMKRFCFRACKLHFDYLGGLGRDVIGNACWAHFIYFLIVFVCLLSSDEIQLDMLIDKQ